MTDQFKVLGLDNTYFENSDIIYWRANHYVRDKEYKLTNAPMAPEDYKKVIYFLSTVSDLARFGTILLYSLQRGDMTNEENERDDASNDNVDSEDKEFLPGYLTRKAAEMVIENDIVRWEKQFGICREGTEYVSMTGFGVGASSILLISPGSYGKDLSELPQGVVVSILCNLENVELEALAFEIARTFQDLKYNLPVKLHEVYNC